MSKENQRVMNVLFIDDNRIDHQVFRGLLELCDVPVRLIVLDNGEAAITFCKNLTDLAMIPDVIFCDINMPKINGWGFLDEYSKLDIAQRKKIPLYMISNSLMPEEIKRANTDPFCNGFITKPVKLHALNAIIMKHASD